MSYHVVEVVHLAGLHIHVWGLMVGLGIFVGAWITARLAPRYGILPERVWTLSLIVAVAGILGSRVLWALQPSLLGRTLEDPFLALRVWEGGLTFVGGLLGAVLAALWYLRRSGLPLRRVADLVVPGFGVGLAIGRLGCFLTGLHPGEPTSLPWGIDYLGAVRHPIPLYESGLGLLLAAAALLLLRRGLRPGLVGLFGGAGYLTFRSLLDLLRAGEQVTGADPRFVGAMTLTQAIAVAAVPVLIGGGVWLWRSGLGQPEGHGPSWTT